MHIPNLEPHKLQVGDWSWWDGVLYLRTPTGKLTNLANHTVTGTPEAPTVTPSIMVNRGRPGEWHGYLTDGQLRDC